MPVPPEYLRVGEFFTDFLLRVKAECMLTSRHQAYTCMQAVITVFRRRLTPEQVIRFVQILPPVVGTILVDGWSPEEFTTKWGSREDLTAEVRRFRHDHNLSTDSTITDVARAIRATIGDEVLDTFLADLGPDAQTYWRI